MEAQVFADFLTKMTPEIPVESVGLTWTLHVNCSSNNKGSGAELILENQKGFVVEVLLGFSVATSNN